MRLFPTDCLNSAGNQNTPSPPNQLPHTRTALATKPRRQLPGNQTMPELLAVVLVCVRVEDSLCLASKRWKVGKELRKRLSDWKKRTLEGTLEFSVYRSEK